VLAAVVAAMPRAEAQAAGSGTVDVIEVSGLLDPVLADFVGHAVRDVERRPGAVLVIQLNSGGAVVSDRTVASLADAIRRGPVAVWVGPSGARATGATARLAAAAGARGRAPGTRVAVTVHPDVDAPTLGDFIVGLDGRSVGGRTMHTARVVQRGGQPRREPVVQVRF